VQKKNLKIGVKLKHARRLNGLKLKELAEIVGCTESFLSKVENDKVRPSLQMLHKIVGALNTSIGALFSETYGRDHVVLRAGQRPVLQISSRRKVGDVRFECLIPYQDSKLLYGSIHVIEPGGGSEGSIRHQGEEVGYVLEGEFELTVDKKTYHLSAGDSFFFESDLPHGYRNPGNQVTRVLWINTPPTF
jgi:transcriptional regulator with XRE-family HTH domain